MERPFRRRQGRRGGSNSRKMHALMGLIRRFGGGGSCQDEAARPIRAGTDDCVVMVPSFNLRARIEVLSNRMWVDCRELNSPFASHRTWKESHHECVDNGIQ